MRTGEFNEIAPCLMPQSSEFIHDGAARRKMLSKNQLKFAYSVAIQRVANFKEFKENINDGGKHLLAYKLYCINYC